MDQQAEKRKDRKSNRTRQKNKRRDSKVESNDSPEIPDTGETSDIPGLPSGGLSKEYKTVRSKDCTVGDKGQQLGAEVSIHTLCHLIE